MENEEILELYEQVGVIASEVNNIDVTLNAIREYIELFNMFLQIGFYGVIVLLIIYFGYWFFSRFFY